MSSASRPLSLKFRTSLYILIDSVDIVTTSAGVGVTVMSGKTHSFVYYHAPQTKLVTSKCHSAHTPASEVKMSPPAGARELGSDWCLHFSSLIGNVECCRVGVTFIRSKATGHTCWCWRLDQQLNIYLKFSSEFGDQYRGHSETACAGVHAP